LADFRKYKTAISGNLTEIDGYASGMLPEFKYYMTACCLYQKKMLKHWDKLICDEIIATNHDDAFYDFLL
jgi:hypothetical protein